MKNEKLQDYLKRQAEGKIKVKPPKLDAEALKTIKCIQKLEEKAAEKEKLAAVETKIKEILARKEKLKKIEKADEPERQQINFTESHHWNRNNGDFQRTQIMYNGGSFNI
jgi:hypothetical protein